VDLSITGAAPLNNRRKRKQSKAGSKNVGRKRKHGTAAEDTGQRKDRPELTQLMEMIEEGTADNANMNTRNLLHLSSTQRRNKTSASNVNEHLMFEEYTLTMRNVAIWETAMMKGQKPTSITKASISEKCWSHPTNQLEMMGTTLTM
jgi:hypothetical protein